MNNEVPLPICGIPLRPPGLVLIPIVGLLFTLLIFSNKFNFKLAVALTRKAAYHFISIVMDIIDTIAIDPRSCRQNLASLGPLGLTTRVLLEELPHAFDSDDADQVHIEGVFLIDFLLLREPNQLVDSSNLLVRRLAYSGATAIFLLLDLV